MDRGGGEWEVVMVVQGSKCCRENVCSSIALRARSVHVLSAAGGVLGLVWTAQACCVTVSPMIAGASHRTTPVCLGAGLAARRSRKSRTRVSTCL